MTDSHRLPYCRKMQPVYLLFVRDFQFQ